MKQFLLLLILPLWMCAFDAVQAQTEIQADVAIYGGTASGVMSAVQVARMNKSVILLEPGGHIGGASVEGLGGTDIDNHKDFKNGQAVGGLAADFYLRLGQKYGKAEGVPQYKFEPHVAEQVFEDYVREHHIPVLRWHRLKEKDGVVMDAETKRIRSIQMENGVRVKAAVFIDATIEGDLMAFAGVSYVIGREANAQYGETKNGIRAENTYRQFEVPVDPYVIPGKPGSGLIPTIQNAAYGTPGAADGGIQGYCFRLCLTSQPNNRIPFQKPDGYNAAEFEIYLRYLAAGGRLFSPSAGLPNGKTDLGSWHDLSLNLYGMNWEYPGGSYAKREEILKEHLRFTQGLCYFLANDPQVPEVVRAKWRDWGVCKDEFRDNGGWPRMFYVRDARRMLSDYVITEHHTKRQNATPVEDPVCVAYWPPDTHHVRRIVKDGKAYNEGFVFGGDDWGPFGISYRALVPKKSECVNLLVPSCPSSTHVAYGAIRLEWTFMCLGQAAGTAAALAVGEGNKAVQDVDYAAVRKQLQGDGQVLHVSSR